MKDGQAQDGNGDLGAFENHENGLVANEEGRVEATTQFDATVDGSQEDGAAGDEEP